MIHVNKLNDIKVKCIVELDNATISLSELKKFEETGMIEIEQLEELDGREVKLYAGEFDTQIIAYGVIVIENGRYAIKITDIAE